MSKIHTLDSNADLLRLRDLLEEKTGIYFSAEKLDRLEEPFRDAKSGLASKSPQEVIQAILSDSSDGRFYLHQLVAALATNETYFFRITSHFQVLRNYLIPELIQTKISQGKKKLRIWSAGCSTGEEPYSIAILLLETLPDIHAWNINILATDIDMDALEKAQEGIYRRWSFRGVQSHVIRDYFHEERRERFQIDDRVRSLVTFHPLNLKNGPYPSAHNGTSDLDIVLCRNVTIYFRPETNQEIIRKFYSCLNEGGFLLMGAAEFYPQTHQVFEVRVFPESLVYQRPLPEQKSPRKEEWTSPPKPTLPLLPSQELPSPAGLQSKSEQPPEKRKQKTEKKKEKDPVDEAVELIASGEMDKALLLLARLAEKNAQDARVCFLLGQIAADRHHVPDACHWLSRTLALDPLHLWAHYLLALLRLHEGKMDEALRSLKKAVYIDPGFALGHFYLGRVYKEQGQVEKARTNFAAVKSLLGSNSLSGTLHGAEGMTPKQLLMLVERELSDEG
jgi:chemotaxis protein methyltransferase CheR